MTEREYLQWLLVAKTANQQNLLTLYRKPVEQYSLKTGAPLPVDTVMRLMSRDSD